MESFLDSETHNTRNEFFGSIFGSQAKYILEYYHTTFKNAGTVMSWAKENEFELFHNRSTTFKDGDYSLYSYYVNRKKRSVILVSKKNIRDHLTIGNRIVVDPFDDDAEEDANIKIILPNNSSVFCPTSEVKNFLPNYVSGTQITVSLGVYDDKPILHITNAEGNSWTISDEHAFNNLISLATRDD